MANLPYVLTPQEVKVATMLSLIYGTVYFIGFCFFLKHHLKFKYGGANYFIAAFFFFFVPWSANKVYKVLEVFMANLTHGSPALAFFTGFFGVPLFLLIYAMGSSMEKQRAKIAEDEAKGIFREVKKKEKPQPPAPQKNPYDPPPDFIDKMLGVLGLAFIVITVVGFLASFYHAVIRPMFT